jgi:hypothetical protein
MTTLGTSDPLAADVVSAVRQAAESASRRPRQTLFAQMLSSPGERLIAPILGLYLGYAVVRLPEIFPALAVPHLPMILMLIFIALLVAIVPADGWTLLWRRSRPLKIVIALLGVVVVTAPLGIWPSESLQFLKDHYATDVLIFVCCLVFLRDRRNLRRAVALYVLATAVVSFHVVRTYDPNAIILNEDGDPIDPEIVAERPELRRLQSVGASLDSNDFGAVLATTFPLALWLSVGSLGRRVFWTGIAGLMVLAVVPTQSRGSELGFVAAAAVIVAMGARGWRRWFSAALILACVGVFVAMATGIGASGRFADFGAEDYNIAGNEGRFFFWRQGMVWMLKRPWGYGISNYSTYFGILNGQERAAHSSWVQYGMELGVAGLVLFIALCWLLVKGLRSLRKRAASLSEQHPAARSEETLAGHMVAMLAGVLVTGTFLSNAYYPLMYMALGFAAATLIGTPLPDDVTPTAEPSRPPSGTSRRRVRRFPSQLPVS